jgi:hypothetical protein
MFVGVRVTGHGDVMRRGFLLRRQAIPRHFLPKALFLRVGDDAGAGAFAQTRLDALVDAIDRARVEEGIFIGRGRDDEAQQRKKAEQDRLVDEVKS